METPMKAPDERDVAHLGDKLCSFRTEDIARSEEFRRLYADAANIVPAADQPFERSPDGLIKHLVNGRMNTRECCIDAYMQFLPQGGRSGRHRHMWEEVLFVAEGSGYDLHWDLKFDCVDRYDWDWESEAKRFDWQRGDFIYVPPFTIHQHFNAAADGEARLIVISNRIVKAMGFDWLDQLENAPGF
jgi:mannose-6-phosphate isomerase-like protein (cupin superfamily)